MTRNIRYRARNRALALVTVIVAVAAGSMIGVQGLGREAPVQYAHASWGYDVSDDRKLVGASDHVFVGSILDIRPGTWGLHGQVDGTLPDGAYPATAYTVRPEVSIKGKLAGDVVVVQHGARTADGQVRLFEDDSLLVVGKTYLFLANQLDGYLLLHAPGFDHLAIPGADRQQELIDRFKAAEENQIDPFARLDLP